MVAYWLIFRRRYTGFFLTFSRVVEIVGVWFLYLLVIELALRLPFLSGDVF